MRSRGGRRARVHQFPRRDPQRVDAPAPRDHSSAVDAYGSSEIGRRNAVVVEFVSANPTGPLHVGHGRQAALGDALAALLDVHRLGGDAASSTTTTPARRSRTSPRASWHASRSCEAAPLVIPEGGYHGEYIGEIAEQYVAAHPGDPHGR